MRIVETRRQAAALPVHTAMLESLSCLSSHMPFVSATLGLMLSAILQSVSPALITEEVEHLLVDLLRNVEHTPTAPFLHAGGKRVNVLMGTTAMFDFQENFSFAPLFSILSPQQAVRLSALIIAYAYDPRDIYVHFLCNQATASGLPFLDVLEAIQLGFRFALIRRAARIIALHELLLEGRIEAVDSSCDVMQFMGIFGRLSKDVRENVLLKFACVNSPIPDKGEKAVCFDTARVWMRCEVLQRRNGEIFVHYENWTDKWDEWLEENGPKVKPWSNATAANVFTPNISRKQIAAAKIEVMRLLRTGFWTFRQPFFAAPTEEVPKVNRADIDAQTIY